MAAGSVHFSVRWCLEPPCFGVVGGGYVAPSKRCVDVVLWHRCCQNRPCCKFFVLPAGFQQPKTCGGPFPAFPRSASRFFCLCVSLARSGVIATRSPGLLCACVLAGSRNHGIRRFWVLSGGSCRCSGGCFRGAAAGSYAAVPSRHPLLLPTPALLLRTARAFSLTATLAFSRGCVALRCTRLLLRRTGADLPASRCRLKVYVCVSSLSLRGYI